MEKKEPKREGRKILEKDHKGWIFLKGQQEYQGIDIKMLQYNKIPGFLELRIRYVDEECLYYYDASGLCSLMEYLNGKQLDYKKIKAFYGDIVRIYRSCKEYFLQEENCILQPEYLFWNERKGKWKVCYFPEFGESPDKQLEELNQYLLQKINHQDKQGVKFLYGIYELIQQEGYYLEGIEDYIREFAEKEKGVEENEVIRTRKKGRKEETPVFSLKKITPCYSAPDRVEITSNDFRIGRLEDNDLVLPIAQISRRHAKIMVEKNRLYLYDFQSTNGTSVNGIKIAGNQEVSCREKDVISFGSLSYEIQRI